MLLSVVTPFLGVTAVADKGEPTASVSGVVIGDESEQPLEEITVSIGEAVADPEPIAEVQTNAAGEFDLEEIPEGEYILYLGPGAADYHTKITESFSHTIENPAEKEIRLTPVDINFSLTTETDRHVSPGETITIDALVENTGEQPYEETIFITRDDTDETVSEEDLEIAVGESIPFDTTIATEQADADSEVTFIIDGPGVGQQVVEVLVSEPPVIHGTITDANQEAAQIDRQQAWTYIEQQEGDPIAGHIDDSSQYAIPIPEAGTYQVHSDGHEYIHETHELSIGDSEIQTHDVSLTSADAVGPPVLQQSIEHVGGTEPHTLPELNVFGEDMVQISVEDPDPETENVQELAGLGVDETTIFKIALEIEDFESVSLIGTGDVQSHGWEQHTADGTTDIVIYVSPKSAQYITDTEPTFESWPEGKADQADIAFEHMITLALADESVIGTGADEFAGLSIQTDAQVFTYPMYYRPDPTEPGTLEVEVGGPHYTVDGNANEGYYEAYLPAWLLESWDVHDPEAELVASYRGDSADLTVTELESGGATITLDLEYSVGSVEVTAEPEPHIEVVDADVWDEFLSAGMTTTVAVDIENTHTSPQEIDLELIANGEVVYSTSATVGSDSSVTDHLTFDPPAPGEYELSVNGVHAGTVTVEDILLIDAIQITDPSPGNGEVNTNDSLNVEIDLTSDSNVEDVSATLSSQLTSFEADPITATQVSDSTWEVTVPVDRDAVIDDGQYDLEITANNAAGSRTSDSATETIHIDRRAPGLAAVIASEGNELASGTDATITVRSTAALERAPTVMLTTPGGQEAVSVAESGDREWAGTFTIGDSGTYQATITGTDLAGNTGETTTSTQIVTDLTVSDDEPTVIENHDTGTAVVFETDDTVEGAYVSLAENDEVFEDTGLEQVGYGSLTGDIDPALAASLESATIQLAVPAQLEGVNPEEIELHRYDGTKWQDFDTSYVADGAGDYWEATVPHFSTYAPLVSDTTPPEITTISPDPGSTFDEETGTVTVSVEYDDPLSGIDITAISVEKNGNEITGADEVTITSESTTIAVEADAGESVDISVAVADNAGNTNTASTSFSITESDSDADDPGSIDPPGDITGLPAPSEPDTPADPVVQITNDDPMSATIALEAVSPGEEITIAPDGPTALSTTQHAAITALTITPSETVQSSLTVSAFEPADFDSQVETSLPSIRDSMETTTPLTYLAIDHEIPSDGFEEASFTFTIPTDSLTTTDGTAEDVTVLRGEDGTWVPYEPEYIGESDGEQIYSVDLPGFSVFAIATEDHSAQADIVLTDIQVDTDVLPAGDTVSIELFLTNRGSEAGEREVTVSIDDEPVGSPLIEVPAETDVVHTLTETLEEPGTYTIASGEETTSITVQEPASTATPSDPVEPDDGIQTYYLLGIVVLFGVLGGGIYVSLRRRSS